MDKFILPIIGIDIGGTMIKVSVAVIKGKKLQLDIPIIENLTSID